MQKLYILDDEHGISEPLRIWFEMKGYEVKSFTRSADLVKSVAAAKPAIVLMDINLNGEDGRDTCRALKKKYKSSFPVILFSAVADYGKDYELFGADGFISKPFRLGEMADMVTALIEKQSISKINTSG